MTDSRLLVVGGGITGLAAAWEAVNRGASVTLVEASDRLGGKIRTEPFFGRPLEAGADAFLARVPEGRALVEEVGLGPDLVSPAATEASVWVGSRVRRLPEKTLLGVPTDLVALARSGVCSGRGVARAALDLVLPGGPPAGDVAVGALVRRRLGREVFERLVDPLLGGINAGRSEWLSLQAGVPQLAAAFDRRSLILGARAHRPPPSGEPVFFSVRGGLGRLVDRLRERLVESGATVLTGWRAGGLALDDDGWHLRRAGTGPAGSAETITGDAVVLTTPAEPTAVLLADVAPASAAGLLAIRHASVAMVALAYPRSAFPRPPAGSGFLVPRGRGRVMTACSWASNKWPDAADPDTVVVRASAGRAADLRAMRMSDDDLVARIDRELSSATGVNGPPTAFRVTRWPDAFPQYAPGHLDRVARIEAALPATLEVAGATYRGVGIPACIRGGRAAASRALAAVTAPV